MSSLSFDIAVIGAGHAGAEAARDGPGPLLVARADRRDDAPAVGPERGDVRLLPEADPDHADPHRRPALLVS
jgi:flavin-dependent dehydrogenase